MTLRQLFIASIARFTELKNARRQPFGKVVVSTVLEFHHGDSLCHSSLASVSKFAN